MYSCMFCLSCHVWMFSYICIFFIYTFTQLKQKNTIIRYVNIDVPGIQVKKGLNKEQRMAISQNICQFRQVVWESLFRLGKHIFTNTKDQKQSLYQKLYSKVT